MSALDRVGIVRWGNCLSMIFPIIAGVRQGGLLSPALFAIYVDDLITRLKASKFGCCVNGVYYGCPVYADDVLFRDAPDSNLYYPAGTG